MPKIGLRQLWPNLKTISKMLSGSEPSPDPEGVLSYLRDRETPLQRGIGDVEMPESIIASTAAPREKDGSKR
jgi:hypothetical protein